MRSGEGILRGAALALLSAMLTAAGHAAAGGALPDLGLLVVLLPLLAGVFGTLAQRCRTLVGIVTVLAAGQLALHHLMELLHPAHAAGPAVLGGAGMLAMHAVATVVLAAAVRHADSGVAAVHAALRRMLPRRPVIPVPVRPLPTAVPAAPSVGLRLAVALAAASVRRGPPVGC